MKILILGGTQKKTALPVREEWHLYHAGLMIELDAPDGPSVLLKRYVTRPEACPAEKPSSIFKAGTLRDGVLYVCTQTEVILYNYPSLTERAYISLPCFNDLHHVSPTSRGTILVAVTGLDMAVEIDEKGKILREWPALEKSVWERFSRDVDYRKVPTTKPHYSHPNYIFEADGQVWLTRFEQRDAVCLTEPNRKVQFTAGRVHDGTPWQGKNYFTSVDGHVFIADMARGVVEQHIDLNTSNDSGKVLGWCRGILPLPNNLAIIGFTRIRPTKIQENVAWVRRQLNVGQEFQPTNISLYDLSVPKLIWRRDMENSDLNAVFSIHAV